jgi:hypothetical protein
MLNIEKFVNTINKIREKDTQFLYFMICTFHVSFYITACIKNSIMFLLSYGYDTFMTFATNKRHTSISCPTVS